MRIQSVIGFAGAIMMAMTLVTPVSAGGESGARTSGSQKPASQRGGYSYDYEDSINTYGDSRSNFGGATSLRDPMLDRQTQAGPFDHGFFFDSGIAPRGGDSPYMQ